MPADVRETKQGSVIHESIKCDYLSPSAQQPTHCSEFPWKWNITLVSRTGNRLNDIQGEYNEFGTGLKLTAPEGWSLRLMAHPSLRSMGYSMEPIDVIPGAKQLSISLFKFNDAQDIELPFIAVTVEVVRIFFFDIPGDVRNTDSDLLAPRSKSKAKKKVVRLVEEDAEDEEDDAPRTLRVAKRRSVY